eukprot:gb/GFBE01069146.1/.p1 GENE.gb/GFBE01069146.1/~~gb/GFBE01069146.1/.p1  ORF type:complete len:194 (+),score=32.10 gb/GFBE01069146.1/:1-582(+)
MAMPGDLSSRQSCRSRPFRIALLLVLVLCAWTHICELNARAFVAPPRTASPGAADAGQAIRGLHLAVHASSEDTPNDRRGDFAPGDIAVLKEIEKRPELNGERVRVDRWDEEKGAWIVQEGGRELTLFAQNLKLVRREKQEEKKDREVNPVMAVVAVVFTLLGVGTVALTIIPVFLAAYKIVTGEYLISLDPQ